MGNEPSKRASSRREERSSKSMGSAFSGGDKLLSSFCDLCAPSVSPATAATDESSQKNDSIASTLPQPPANGPTTATNSTTDKSRSSGGVGRPTQQVRTPASGARPPKHPTSQAPDKSDRSIKTSIRNVQMDVTAIQNEQKKRVVPMEDSAHTFAASLASQSGHFRKGNDYVMITDALSDVRANYHIDPKEIGHGHYGVVRKCMHRESGNWYAIKSIRKAKVSKIEVLKREIEILKEVKHPHIIELIEVYEDERYLHLVTELCTGGELFDRIIAKTQSAEGHFSEHDAAKLVRDILDAIGYCHDVKQIVHRDLKPENFLFLTEDEHSPIKIIDFGLSRHDDAIKGVMQTKVGTPYYVAPEVLRREYTNSCDIWSIGVITYILLCGYPPFYGDSDTQIFDAVKVGKFDFPSPEWDSVSQSAKNFVVSLLKKDPKERPAATEALGHQWLREQLGESAAQTKKLLRSGNRGAEFSKYLAMKKLKARALGIAASHLTQEQVGYLGEIFKSIDERGRGVITLNELDDAIARGNFPANIQEDLRALRAKLSIAEDATLNWKDFLSGTIDKNLAMREDNIKRVFNHFKHGEDADHLKFEDVVEIFGGESQAQEVMNFLDTDGDGKISFEDFRHAVEESLAEDLDDVEEDECLS